jgi:hypothetical protein
LKTDVETQEPTQAKDAVPVDPPITASASDLNLNEPGLSQDPLGKTLERRWG